MVVPTKTHAMTKLSMRILMTTCLEAGYWMSMSRAPQVCLH